MITHYNYTIKLQLIYHTHCCNTVSMLIAEVFGYGIRQSTCMTLADIGSMFNNDKVNNFI